MVNETEHACGTSPWCEKCIPEWVKEFRRKCWAMEERFLASERDTFQALAYERQRQVEEAYRLSRVTE